MENIAKKEKKKKKGTQLGKAKKGKLWRRLFLFSFNHFNSFHFIRNCCLPLQHNSDAPFQWWPLKISPRSNIWTAYLSSCPSFVKRRRRSCPAAFVYISHWKYIYIYTVVGRLESFDGFSSSNSVREKKWKRRMIESWEKAGRTTLSQALAFSWFPIYIYIYLLGSLSLSLSLSS